MILLPKCKCITRTSMDLSCGPGVVYTRAEMEVPRGTRVDTHYLLLLHAKHLVTLDVQRTHDKSVWLERQRDDDELVSFL